MSTKCRSKKHDYKVSSPIWAKSEGWQCIPWRVAVGKDKWYCRHVLICDRCGKNKDLPSEQCPDRPEDDGTIEFYER